MADNVITLYPANSATAPKRKAKKPVLDWMAIMLGGDFCTIYENGSSFLAPKHAVFGKPEERA